MQKLKPELSAAPASDLISLEEAKRHVRRDDDDDDALITSLIAVVMSRIDGFDGILNRALINQTWIERAADFPASDVLALDVAPVQAITSIKYYDSDNVLQTFDSANYSFHNRTGVGYVKLGNESAWPETYDRDDAIEITYVAGYGADASDVPAAIKHAGLLLIGEYYENREEVLTGTIATRLPDGVMTLLRPFIRPHF